MPPPPSKPEGSPKGSIRKPNRSSSVLVKKPAAINLDLVAQVERDEVEARTAVEVHEATMQGVIARQLQGVGLGKLQKMATDTRATLLEIADVSTATHKGVTSLNAKTERLSEQTDTMATQLAEFIKYQQAKERERLQHLEIENAMLRENLEEAQLECERKTSECQALRDTLSRKLIRTATENDILRQQVKTELENSRIDYSKMEKRLHDAVDGAVLAFQKPAYESKLQSLQAIAAADREELDKQAAHLHAIIEAIGARDAVHESKTMHSNIPQPYRKGLTLMNKDQLLSLIDVFSFEDGIVELIGKALYAADPTKTQSVFH